MGEQNIGPNVQEEAGNNYVTGSGMKSITALTLLTGVAAYGLLGPTGSDSSEEGLDDMAVRNCVLDQDTYQTLGLGQDRVSQAFMEITDSHSVKIEVGDQVTLAFPTHTTEQENPNEGIYDRNVLENLVRAYDYPHNEVTASSLTNLAVNDSLEKNLRYCFDIRKDVVNQYAGRE